MTTVASWIEHRTRRGMSREGRGVEIARKERNFLEGHREIRAHGGSSFRRLSTAIRTIFYRENIVPVLNMFTRYWYTVKSLPLCTLPLPFFLLLMSFHFWMWHSFGMQYLVYLGRHDVTIFYCSASLLLCLFQCLLISWENWTFSYHFHRSDNSNNKTVHTHKI